MKQIVRIPLTQVHRDVAGLVHRVAHQGTTLVITKREHPLVVMMPAAEYNLSYPRQGDQNA